jgi:hypothetical protein
MLIGRGSSSASMRFLSANMSMLKLTRVPRVPTLGELTASMAHEVKQPPPAAGVTNAETCLRQLPDVIRNRPGYAD